MIKKVISMPVYLMIAVIMLSVTSCVRERDTDTSVAEELAFHEFAFHDASDLADDAATKKTGETLSNYKTTGYCATLTHDQVSNPRTIIIDFGPTNCMCNDGRNRNGKILVSYTGNYTDSGSEHTITFENYYVDDYLVMGTNVVTNRGLNGASQPKFTSVINGKVLKPGSLDTLFYEAQRNIVWTEGSTTPVWGDDVYEITGTATGKNELKTFYAMTITQPLVKEVLGCRYFTKGKIEMQPQGKALRVMDFGNGSCDNDATVTLNNKVFNIKLK